ncbi:tripartite tricarboxylate transporter TctB family protein [uncultured Limimaricola sp.]|uniref:tripartite tricarboxylate transporter TctB family protein n=1 Tax=uncultured Limimaricola sp. TaxID=2211667 RepID=UPI0030FBD579
MLFRNSGRRIDWGHLALIALMAGCSLAYLIDARGTSLKTGNLALVQPAAIFVFILSAVVLSQAFPKRDPAEERPEIRAARRAETGRVALLAMAFGAFVFSLETLGFDLATFVFVACGLYLCGERRLWVIGLYALVFAYLVVTGYQMLVPYPFPMMVL